jgi:sec-independent protein translocase protein TatA
MFRNPTTDLIIALVIVLLIFGPKRLPGLGKQLGQGLREFKDSITGDSKSPEDEQRPEIARTSAPPIAGTGEPSISAEPTPASTQAAPANNPSARESAERSS